MTRSTIYILVALTAIAPLLISCGLKAGNDGRGEDSGGGAGAYHGQGGSRGVNSRADETGRLNGLDGYRGIDRSASNGDFAQFQRLIEEYGRSERLNPRDERDLNISGLTRDVLLQYQRFIAGQGQVNRLNPLDGSNSMNRGVSQEGTDGVSRLNFQDAGDPINRGSAFDGSGEARSKTTSNSIPGARKNSDNSAGSNSPPRNGNIGTSKNPR